MKAIKFVGCLLWAVSFSISAQNTMTSSPYSMFGVGEISSGLYGQNVSMGGVSYGMRSSSFINMENPAGLTSLDSCKLFMEISAFARNENYESKGKTNHVFTGNFSGLVLGGRIMKSWYMAAGLTPYSSVGYYFQSNQTLEGAADASVTSTFEGSGGLSKATLSNAIQLPYHLSLGVNAHYIFGSITQKESQASIQTQQELDARAFYMDLGLQYHRRLGPTTSLGLGAVYGYKQKLSFSHTTSVSSSAGTSESQGRNVTQYLPMYVGAGLSLQHKTMTYALDYTYREYRVVNSGQSTVRFKDTHELRTGFCYDPAAGDPYNKSYWRKVQYKAGFDLSNPYMQINGKNGLNWRVSGGFSFPVLDGMLNTSFFYDHTQYGGNTFQRGIVGVVVSFSLAERFYRVRL